MSLTDPRIQIADKDGGPAITCATHARALAAEEHTQLAGCRQTLPSYIGHFKTLLTVFTLDHKDAGNNATLQSVKPSMQPAYAGSSRLAGNTRPFD